MEEIIKKRKQRAWWSSLGNPFHDLATSFCPSTIRLFNLTSPIAKITQTRREDVEARICHSLPPQLKLRSSLHQCKSIFKIPMTKL